MATLVNLAIVVKADGTVPFDGGVPAAHKQAMLSALTDDGHLVEPIAGTPHYKIKVWPHEHDSKLFGKPKSAAPVAAPRPAAPSVVINKPEASKS